MLYCAGFIDMDVQKLELTDIAGRISNLGTSVDGSQQVFRQLDIQVFFPSQLWALTQHRDFLSRTYHCYNRINTSKL